MTLSWYKITEGDYAADSKTALYDIEQCGKDRWMAFMNDTPVGIYSSLSSAQTRCETLEAEGCAAQAETKGSQNDL